MGAGHAHPHTHTHDEPPPASQRVRRLMIALMAPMMIVTAVAMILLWPNGTSTAIEPDGTTRATGRLLAVHEVTCPEPEPGTQPPTGLRISRCGSVTVRISDGQDAGRTVDTPMPNGPGAPTVRVGDDVVLIMVTDPADPAASQYNIIDHQRGSPLLAVVVVFAAAIIGFGRLRGLAALGGLVVSFAILLAFVLPAIMDGRSPLLVAIVGSAAIMFAVLYLTHGVTVQTSVAVLGTLASLVLTGVLGTMAAAATHLTGYGSEDANTLALFYRDVDLHGLLLAGIIIGALGVLDDVTVTQAATVTELAAANPSLNRLQLYAAATRIGRAHIASTVNTIVLAYAGASLPLLLLILGSGRGVAETLTSEFLAQEIVRSAVGTLGLIAAVPITTGLAALIAASDKRNNVRPRRARSGDHARDRHPRWEHHDSDWNTGRHRSEPRSW